MKKYLFLSSAFLMTMAGANAADKIITSANTCTVDVLGVSDNNAVANTIATWDLIDYTLDPGEYLNVTDTSVTETTCPAGSYCVGGGYTVETADNSIAQCPTTHPNSADGASADTQCYTACTVDMVAKATAVTGNDYFGAGVDTCEPTACIAGWHVRPRLNLTDLIGDLVGTDSACISNTGLFIEQNFDNMGKKGQDYYGITDPMSFAVIFGERGMVTGQSRCSTIVGNYNNYTWSNPTIVDELVDETNQDGALYCYCRLNSYKDVVGNDVTMFSTPWLYSYGTYSTADNCAIDCAMRCTDTLRNEKFLGFRTVLFNITPDLPATCAANTINIDWNPDNGGDHIKNMCTYEGEITLPTPDPVKPGYTFTGWKLVDGTTTE